MKKNANRLNSNSKATNKKRTYIKRKTFKKVFPLLLSFAIILTLTFILVLVLGKHTVIKPTQTPHRYTAAIIDQLSDSFPNKNFISKSQEILKKAGFDVRVYKGNEVNVSLLKELPYYEYNLIIFRAHSGLSTVNGKLDQTTFIFTNEKYNRMKYPKEQLSDEIVPAKVTENSPGYFAIGPKFIMHLNKPFNHTIIIMTGCAGLKVDDLAKAFIQKGASCYIAWDASVTADYMDKATLHLLTHLFDNRETVESATTNTIKDTGLDPDYNAFLRFYPQWVNNETFTDLIKSP